MSVQSVYDFEVKNIDGENVKLSQYTGKVLLIVNTASKCGFTPQFKGLEELYLKYKEKGLAILGFPCNQFASQEPLDEKGIKEYCSLTYNVTFPMFSKVDVNGENASALFKYLKNQASGIFGTEIIKWNFTKFLVDKQGKVVSRFAPKDTPESLVKHIEKIL